VARVSVDEQVTRVLPELYALTTIEDHPVRALSVVRSAIGADKGDYTEVDLSSGDFRVLVDPEPPELGQLRAARELYMHEHPVSAHFLGGAPHAARLISDFLSRRAFQRLGLYGEFFRPLGVEDQLTVTVSSRASGCLAGVSVDRGRPGFDEEDRRLMDSLQPHLAVARENAVRFSRALARQPLVGEPVAPALDRLTHRQREILAQLSHGLTNGQIACALDISVGTVRKHLEHILQRLEVPTRTAAAVYYITANDTVRSSRWTASTAAMFSERGHVEDVLAPTAGGPTDRPRDAPGFGDR
jgi:DNA-binding CsgD family transcriptional regulator